MYAGEITRATSSEQQRILAFVLEMVLRRWEYDVADRPYALSEAAALCRIFQQPVVQASECLAGQGGDPIEIAAALVKAVASGLPPLNPKILPLREFPECSAPGIIYRATISARAATSAGGRH
jgi:hypothetical protein